jgi:hypothetical protein
MKKASQPRFFNYAGLGLNRFAGELLHLNVGFRLCRLSSAANFVSSVL